MGGIRRVSFSDAGSSSSSRSSQLSPFNPTAVGQGRQEEVRHGVMGLGRLDISDDDEEETKEAPAVQGGALPPWQPPVGAVEVSDDSEEDEAPRGRRRLAPIAPVGRADISDDSDDEKDGEKHRSASGLPPAQTEEKEKD